VIAEAIRQYRSSSIDQLDPELRGLIISTVVRHDHRPDDIDALIQDYSATINPELQHDICGALTSSRDHDTLLRLIGLLKDTKVIRLQDTVSWFVSLLRNRFSRQEVWDWMRREWPWIGEMYFSEKSYDSFPKYAAMCLMTASQLDEFTAFFTPMRDDPSLTRAIDMGIVDLTARVELIEKDGPAVIARLAQL
ncbi:MAG: ERAP1-like C-terminal domain-containing protein, partial [Candidatus Saccharimonas aalborgensis]